MAPPEHLVGENIVGSQPDIDGENAKDARVLVNFSIGCMQRFKQ